MTDENNVKSITDADGAATIKSLEGAIEAILYAAGYPVKYEKIAEVLGLDVRNTKTLIAHMSEAYMRLVSIVSNISRGQAGVL